MGDRRIGFPAAFVRTMLLSVPLVLIPVAGPFVAALLGGRGAGRSAAGAGMGAAALWVALLWWASGQSLMVGGTSVSLGPFLLLAPVIAGGLIGGGLCAAGGSAKVGVGVLVLLAGAVWSGVQVGPVWTLLSEFRPQQQAEAGDVGGCPDNLKKLYTAARLYADSWDDMLPPADVWMDRISEYVGDASALRCPSVAKGTEKQYGYAMNSALSGKVISGLGKQATTPLFYDSSSLGRNASDPVSSLPKPGRHGGRNNAVYLDGHVAEVGAP
jgi:prepilin-type processing-associated H-X9-DG protein